MGINIIRAGTSQDIVSEAKSRRTQIAQEIANLKAEDAELETFLQTAARIQARLAASQPAPAPAPPRKATKKDVVDRTMALIRQKGGPVTTGEVVEAMEKEGWDIGTGSSSASSVVSANLGAAVEIMRGPDGRGWVESPIGKLM